MSAWWYPGGFLFGQVDATAGWILMALIGLAVLIAAVLAVVILTGMRYIPNNRVGIVENAQAIRHAARAVHRGHLRQAAGDEGAGGHHVELHQQLAERMRLAERAARAGAERIQVGSVFGHHVLRACHRRHQQHADADDGDRPHAA